jgi:hypothetical protein
MKRWTGFVCAALLAAAAIGCPPPVYIPPTTDEYGCPEPPADIFTKRGVNVGFGRRVLKSMAAGTLPARRESEAMTFAGRLSRLPEVRAYISCLQAKSGRFSAKQAAYLTALDEFLTTGPSPEQFRDWYINQEKPAAPAIRPPRPPGEEPETMPPAVAVESQPLEAPPPKPARIPDLETKAEKLAYLDAHYHFTVVAAEAFLTRRGGSVRVECRFDTTGPQSHRFPVRLVAVVHTDHDYIVRCHAKVEFEPDAELKTADLSGEHCFFVDPRGMYPDSVTVLAMLDINDDFKRFVEITGKTPTRLEPEAYADIPYYLANRVPLTFK